MTTERFHYISTELDYQISGVNRSSLLVGCYFYLGKRGERIVGGRGKERERERDSF